MTTHEIADAAPAWANWLIIVGGAAASWLAPLASLVAIVWGLLQIFAWIRKEIRSRKK
jgi:hypothetical protein